MTENTDILAKLFRLEGENERLQADNDVRSSCLRDTQLALAEARRQIAERDEALKAMIAAFGSCRPKTAEQEVAFSQAMSVVLAAPMSGASPRLMTADVLKRSPAIEELTPVQWEWDACISVQDRYNLMKRKVDAALALLASPPTEVASSTNGGEADEGPCAICSDPDDDGPCPNHRPALAPQIGGGDA